MAATCLKTTDTFVQMTDTYVQMTDTFGNGGEQEGEMSDKNRLYISNGSFSRFER
jgi:hypothetical protein